MLKGCLDCGNGWVRVPNGGEIVDVETRWLNDIGLFYVSPQIGKG